MANESEKGSRIKLILGGVKGKLVRFSHLHVFETRLNKESGKLEFSTALLIPKTNVEDVKAIREAIDALKKETWTDNKKPIPPQFWNPLRDGDKDVKQNGEALPEECKGHYLLNVKTGEDNPPDVVGTTRDEKGKFAPLTKADIKSGDWGRASINLGAYTKGSGGVGAYVSRIQLVKKGDPLSSRGSAEDDFGQFDDLDDDAADPLNA